jgi:hypothetical protein
VHTGSAVDQLIIGTFNGFGTTLSNLSVDGGPL